MVRLRTRLFQAVVIIVLLCIGLTLGLGLLLTRRAVDKATLEDVSHQAALLAELERGARLAPPPPSRRRQKPSLKEQHEIYHASAAGLPAAARKLLHHDEAAQGTVSFGGTRYFYAAQPVEGRAFVLLRRQSVTTTQWRPFVWALLIAALAGAGLAGG